MAKLWCSNCKIEYEGFYEDGSYWDEDTHEFHFLPNAFAICRKCGLSTGRDIINQYYKAKPEGT